MSRRGFGQHADDLACRPRFAGMDGGRDARTILFAEVHHQLPEAPPPPDEPPPPAKPPPLLENPPPPNPPEPALRPLINIASAIQRKVGDTIINPITPTRTTMTSQFTGAEAGSLSTRSDGRFCHSEESVVSTVMMSSTPRAMPPLKSAVLKRGVIAFVMITFDSASVSVPSSP